MAHGTAAGTVAGYSSTPLARKLGVRNGEVALLLNVPAGLDHAAGFDQFAEIVREIPQEATRRFDYAHVFTVDREVLQAMATRLFGILKSDGILWVSWPKKASRVPTTIGEGGLRELLLPTGLVDVKVCAVDEVWSGLKFVILKELRAQL